MTANILLLISIILIAISYLKIFITYLTNKNNSLENTTGFDLAKELTSNYDEINIVESKEIYFSKYNLKRRVIRLTPKDYSSTNLYTLSISSLLSSYSLININQDKYLKIIKRFFKHINYLSISPLLAIIISLFTNTRGDAKIGITLLAIILAYQYIMFQINTIANENIQEELKKHVKDKEKSQIMKVLTTLLSFYNISFIVTLVLIIREVLIILKI